MVERQASANRGEQDAEAKETDAEVEAWRELAIETIRNLGSAVEQAESALRRARERWKELEMERED